MAPTEVQSDADRREVGLLTRTNGREVEGGTETAVSERDETNDGPPVDSRLSGNERR